MAQLQRSWFVHLQGENFGPLSTEVVVLMIQQKRLEYWDFIWTQGLDSWARIADMMPFSEMLPPYPDAPLPGTPGEGTISLPNPTQPKEEKVSPPTPQASANAPAVPPPAPTPAKETTSKSAGTRSLRRHGRARISGTAVVENYGTYEIYDIAEGGIFVCAVPPIPVGTDVKFKLNSSSFTKTLALNGVVIREGKTEDGRPGFAIQFSRVNPAHSRMIRDYVHSHQDK